jgi:hypothetical protein
MQIDTNLVNFLSHEGREGKLKRCAVYKFCTSSRIGYRHHVNVSFWPNVKTFAQ